MLDHRTAFRHIPELADRITPPEESAMRFTDAWLEELDVIRAAEGAPPDWRLSHDVREANRRDTLGDVPREVWVFGYGSLIWDPAIYFDEVRRATLDGWHRSFCMLLVGGRGSRDMPGLMAALDRGGRCDGVVFRIPPDRVEEETRYVWRREMIAGTYSPRFFPVATPQGPVTALAFVMNHDHSSYRPEMPPDEAAGIIARAEGSLGPNIAYLESMVRHLADLGVDDPAMTDLYRRACACRSG